MRINGNAAAFVIGILLSSIGTCLGPAVAWRCFHPIGHDSESQFINYSLGAALLAFPAIAMVVGAVVGAIAARDRWWLSGLSLAPLVIAIVIEGVVAGIVLGGLYVGLCLVAAYLVSRIVWRARRP
jgi:hypothetical protein